MNNNHLHWYAYHILKLKFTNRNNLTLKLIALFISTDNHFTVRFNISTLILSLIRNWNVFLNLAKSHSESNKISFLIHTNSQKWWCSKKNKNIFEAKIKEGKREKKYFFYVRDKSKCFNFYRKKVINSFSMIYGWTWYTNI